MPKTFLKWLIDASGPFGACVFIESFIMVALIIAFPRLVSIEKKTDMTEQLELKLDVPSSDIPAPTYEPDNK